MEGLVLVLLGVITCSFPRYSLKIPPAFHHRLPGTHTNSGVLAIVIKPVLPSHEVNIKACSYIPWVQRPYVGHVEYPVAKKYVWWALGPIWRLEKCKKCFSLNIEGESLVSGRLMPEWSGCVIWMGLYLQHRHFKDWIILTTIPNNFQNWAETAPKIRFVYGFFLRPMWFFFFFFGGGQTVIASRDTREAKPLVLVVWCLRAITINFRVKSGDREVCDREDTSNSSCDNW